MYSKIINKMYARRMLECKKSKELRLVNHNLQENEIMEIVELIESNFIDKLLLVLNKLGDNAFEILNKSQKKDL